VPAEPEEALESSEDKPRESEKQPD
jgi:hypothetical protein